MSHPFNPGVLEAAKALADYASCMREQRAIIEAQAEEMRLRWAENQRKYFGEARNVHSA
jgi:hypothetical protein